MKALARFVGSVPGHDHPIELQNLLLEAEQLTAERGNARAGNFWHPFVAGVSNNMEQFRDPLAPDRRDNAELGKMSSDRIDHRSLLTDEQMARAVKHQAALLLRRLGWHEPHVGSGDGFANRLSVSHVVLLTLDVRLHVGRRHQPHRYDLSACSSRDQWCDEAQASMPTKHGGSFWKNARTARRFNWRRMTRHVSGAGGACVTRTNSAL